MPPRGGHGPGGHGPGGGRGPGGAGGGTWGVGWGNPHTRYVDIPSYSSPHANAGSGAPEEVLEPDDYVNGSLRVNIKSSIWYHHSKENNLAVITVPPLGTKIRFGTKVKGFFRGIGISMVDPFAKLRFDWSCRSANIKKAQAMDEMRFNVSSQEEYDREKALIEKEYNLKMFANHERRVRRSQKRGFITMEEYNRKMQEYIDKYHIEASDYTRSH